MDTQINNCLTEVAIKKYINQTLSEEERFRVEDHLLDCPLCADAIEGLASHYDFEKEINLENLDKQIEAKLNREEALVKQLNPPRRFSLNRIAAAILLLLIPLAAWMYWNSNADQKLYASYLPEDTKPMAVVRSSEDMQKLEAPVRQAKKLFDEKRYEASLEACEQVLEKTPHHPLATYYAGLSAIETGHSELARHYLSGLRINEASFYEDATWYLALAEVKAGEKASAKKLLEELIQVPQSIYFNQAKELMEKLD